MSNTQAEIQKFNQMADQCWDPEGPFKPLHDLNPLRLQFIERQTSLYEKHCLDVGCGPGILSEALAQAGANVTGIDLAADLLTAAQLHQYESHVNVHYLKTDIETFCNTHPQTFDVVTCLELLEHVDDPLPIIQACAHACKPEGFIFFSTISRSLSAYLQAIVGAEYVLKLLPKGTHTYEKFIKPSELAQALRQAGLTLVDTTGIHYHPIRKNYYLTEKLDLNYLLCARKL